jgi:hypothetical protein
MKITIESTDMVTTVSGARCRVWRGVTEGGTQCDVAVPMIRVREDADRAQFEKELEGIEPPSEAVSFRHIW